MHFLVIQIKTPREPPGFLLEIPVMVIVKNRGTFSREAPTIFSGIFRKLGSDFRAKREDISSGICQKWGSIFVRSARKIVINPKDVFEGV